jgi:hypothetical protein
MMTTSPHQISLRVHGQPKPRDSMLSSNADTSPQQAGSSQQQQRHARVLAGTCLTGVPLWRVEWAVLPGMQVRTSIQTIDIDPRNVTWCAEVSIQTHVTTPLLLPPVQVGSRLGYRDIWVVSTAREPAESYVAPHRHNACACLVLHTTLPVICRTCAAS